MLNFLGHRRIFACSGFFLLFAAGCQGDPKPARPADSPVDLAASQDMSRELSRIVNDARLKYAPLRYEYAEDLLERLDLIEASLAGTLKGPAPRYFPKLDEDEEKAHLRETTRRWEAATGKKFRVEIDRLKAQVTARKPEERFHPAFQKDFSLSFDEYIKFEVLEMRERCNRAIHKTAESLFTKNREKHPELVRQYEAELNKPEYAFPDKTADTSAH
ncbi:MAG: hypothetical protein NVSMB9_32520 [Isosphaeraceae bacterium]